MQLTHKLKISRILSAMMSLAVVALQNAYSQESPSPLSSTVLLSRDFVRDLPPCEFDYIFKTGISTSRISFRCVKDKFAFERKNDSTGQLTSGLYFDGTRYFSLYEGNYLVVSSNSAPIGALFSSWFRYNPIFNPISSIFHDNEDFGLPYLLDISSWARTVAPLVSTTSAIKTSGNTISININEKWGTNVVQWKSGSLFPTNASGEVSGLSETWSVVNTFNDVYNGKPFQFPSCIKCVYTGSNGESSQYSYEINLVPGTFRFLDSKVTADRFRVPVSAVETVYDADVSIHLKAADWQIKTVK